MTGVTTALLPSQLAQLLVAYTVECDNLFEERMAAAGFSEYGLSLVTWLNFLRYLDVDDPVPVAAVMDRTFVTESQAAQIAGTLERWFVVELDTRNGRGEDRDGWGTSKGIKVTSRVAPTEQGRVALSAWPSVIADVDSRWKSRWKSSTSTLRAALARVASGSDVELPDGVPSGWMRGDWRQFPRGSTKRAKTSPLAVLLSQGVPLATVLFERRCDVPIALGANVVRVLGPDPAPVADLAVRCGLPSQVLSVQCTDATKRGLASVEGAGKKLFRLTAKGRRAQQSYSSTLAVAGDELSRPAPELAETVAAMLSDHERLGQGLTPPEGVARAGAPAPPLGLRTEMCRRRGQEAPLGAAQVARNKELVLQTEQFLRAPRASLPHYPVWDQNRGFGP